MRTTACFHIVTIALGLLLLQSCSEKKGSKEIASPPGPAGCDAAKDPNCKTSDKSGPSAALVDVCGGISQNAAIGEFSALTALICATGTSGLQTLVTANLYAGGATSTVKDLLAEEIAGKQSRMRLLSAMRVTTKPLSYFNLMKLQINQPTQFKSAQFETDDKVTYAVKSSQSGSTLYNYKNTSEAPEVVVDYTANAKFVVLVPDQVYIVATALDTTVSNETVVALKGYSVIYQTSPTMTDVVSISEQTYENNGNHAATLTKAKRAAQNEQFRSYKNGLKADAANSLVK